MGHGFGKQPLPRPEKERADPGKCGGKAGGEPADHPKWETDETLPDIRQPKGLALLYHVTLDELIEYDFDEQQARQMIESVSDEAQARIDWNKVWSKKYPVLATYHQKVRIDDYAPTLREMLTQLRVDYGYNHTDALLVLKDILARVWKGQV